MDRITRRRSGFTLIELLIVICVITILASISMAYLSEVRKRANETSAMATLKAIVNVEQVYRNHNTSYGDMPSLLAQNLVDPLIAGAGKSGYVFAIPAVNVSQYYVTAVPQSAGSGSRLFYTDEAGTIFQSDTATTAPTADSQGSAPTGFVQIGN